MDHPTIDPQKWSDALSSLARVIKKLEGAVIGGVAVSVRSIPRFTRDIDAVCWQGDFGYREILEVLVAEGFWARPDDPVAFAKKHRVFPLVHLSSGIPVDISLGASPFERDLIERAQPVEFEGVSIPVATVEDLVVLKLVAGRPIDVADVDSLIKINLGLDRKYITKIVREFAKHLEAPEIVDTMRQVLSDE